MLQRHRSPRIYHLSDRLPLVFTALAEVEALLPCVLAFGHFETFFVLFEGETNMYDS